VTGARRLLCAAATLLLLVTPGPQAPASISATGTPHPSAPALTDAPSGDGWRVAFFNIQSGKGVAPLRGAAPFATTHNCSDASQPMNAWSRVRAELRRTLADDPRVLALGLAEAWFCGAPEHTLEALGWKAHSGERNGTALLARHGFAAEPEWLQLDTSLNQNPKDTKWVVRAPVCVDASCAQAVPVYVTHWFGTGPHAAKVYQQQSEATVRFMAAEKRPHVLIGDLNVFEGIGRVCNQSPNNLALAPLRAAGYVDVWPAVHGRREGFTGMVNRQGCGTPEGYPWKRIDYVWVRGFRPIAMERFAMSPAGEASLSDHVGIVAALSVPSSPAR
jgi:endonuclease/exonuclease/phosphatase family metal-dependent hydrolase